MYQIRNMKTVAPLAADSDLLLEGSSKAFSARLFHSQGERRTDRRNDVGRRSGLYRVGIDSTGLDTDVPQ